MNCQEQHESQQAPWADFRDWLRQMPRTWQVAVRNALAGGASMAQLDDSEGRGEVAVFFVHPSYAAAIVAAIQDQPGRRRRAAPRD
jgi:hypothetical protein